MVQNEEKITEENAIKILENEIKQLENQLIWDNSISETIKISKKIEALKYSIVILKFKGTY